MIGVCARDDALVSSMLIVQDDGGSGAEEREHKMFLLTMCKI